ncbi:estrogen receptor 2b isoform X1 [Astatotilapia calliptera]|uniref:Estrogen receptor 2b n=1 Tax=Astatotilapia calliptera TaxID=8154 RepID=A0AAX7V328_ASTCA|nr:estrogen receptor beta isoform X1 [Astatotilapia calliptera]XP_026008539.1 estrogen receptor beta isoform X1 [Astatotilapia calliptera]XP_026008540.1 estrogen receptor beta isoform X1 [Astatotilapia calliptera]XP_026008541.1 estrogen receptor beta isoform X1 [Astatotilapia calliptera]XP_026008542.1 estrogen receptor beta isoform X1 [Astatotilapia calliptera]
MTSSPALDANPLPLLQLEEVDSSKATERVSSPGLLPAMYSPPVGMDSHTICIPSPYTDSNHDYNHGHGPFTFYSPSMLSYTRSPITDSPSSLCPPLSPSAFWPSHTHHNVPSLTLHCTQPLVYNEPSPHAPWLDPKVHSISPSSSIISCNKLLGKKSEGAEGVKSSSCSSALGKADMHFCAVCHDYASGYHYGVWSCEGCKAFFKRSIQGHNDYICPATNQCTIDKNRRKSCQACRLRKCYEVGMMKCGVRRERCGFRGARHRRGGPQPRDTTGQSLVRVGLGSRGQRHLHLGTPEDTSVHTHSNHTHHSTMNPEEFISRIMEAEPPEIYLMEDLKKPFTETSMMMTLTNLADKELVLMISWAKKIPGFVELSLTDQIHLLKCCWLEILMLGLMWRSVDHPGKLIFSPDVKLSREEGQCVEGIMEIFDMLLAATSRFRELKLQREEYVCLKAMILLNSSLCTSSPQTPEELESRNKLLHLLDSVIDALVWAISKLGLSTQQQTLRLGHLTMLLSHIRHVSNKGIDHLSSMKRKNAVLVYDLLLEMLDANTASSSSQTSSSSPGSDTYSEQQQFPPPPSDLQPGLDQMATAADNTTVPPAEVPVLDGHLLTLQSTSPSQNLAGSHLDSNDYISAEHLSLDNRDAGPGPSVEPTTYVIPDRVVTETA